MTELSCLSITGCDASLKLLERLFYAREGLAEHVMALRANSHARAVALLSTCQRTEVYATWPGAPDEAALLAALAADRSIPSRAVRLAARTYRGDEAARHLLRVASGLESFVLGETEIAGQVRAAANVSRTAGGGDVVLERLMDAAVSASRKRQQRTSITTTSRSVASVAVDAVVMSSGGTIAGQRLLVVGAGHVAAVVVARVAELGAVVTVCNRTRRHSDQFIGTGAVVVDLADLADCLGTSDIAILATAAPHPLVDARILRSARPRPAGPLTLVDLSLPRNVDSSVRALSWVHLIDLADLRAAGATAAGDLAEELAATEEIIETELRRYLRWLASRSAAAALRRMRADAENIAREETARIAGAMPADTRSSVEQALLKTVHRLVHGPTRELLAAASAGDTRMVNVLAGLFDMAPSTNRRSTDAAGSPSRDPDTASLRRRPPFHAQRSKARAAEQTGDECGVHGTHELAMRGGQIGEDAVAQG
jgi:glutamyl-tRNA reductase